CMTNYPCENCREGHMRPRAIGYDECGCGDYFDRTRPGRRASNSLPSTHFVQDKRTPPLLAGRKVQNVSSGRRTRPIDRRWCSLRFDLKGTQSGPRAEHRVASRRSPPAVKTAAGHNLELTDCAAKRRGRQELPRLRSAKL